MNTTNMWLVYVDPSDGQRYYQHWNELTDIGTYVNEFGDDMELVGWTDDEEATR